MSEDTPLDELLGRKTLRITCDQEPDNPSLDATEFICTVHDPDGEYQVRVELAGSVPEGQELPIRAVRKVVRGGVNIRFDARVVITSSPGNGFCTARAFDSNGVRTGHPFTFPLTRLRSGS